MRFSDVVGLRTVRAWLGKALSPKPVKGSGVCSKVESETQYLVVQWIN